MCTDRPKSEDLYLYVASIVCCNYAPSSAVFRHFGRSILHFGCSNGIQVGFKGLQMSK